MPREPRCSQAELGKSLESSLNRKRQAFWKTREARGPTHSWNLNFSITSLLQPSPTWAAPLGGAAGLVEGGRAGSRTLPGSRERRLCGCRLTWWGLWRGPAEGGKGGLRPRPSRPRG